MMQLDRDRQRVYDAEDAAFGGTILDEPVSWSDLEALFEAIMMEPWWIALDVPRPKLVRARRDSRRSSADGATVRIADAGTTAITLVHELAHHLVRSLSLHDPGHGPTFRAASLRLVALVGGSRAQQMLADAFRNARLTSTTWPRPEPQPTAGLVMSLVDAGPERIRGAMPMPSAESRARAGTEYGPRS